MAPLSTSLSPSILHSFFPSFSFNPFSHPPHLAVFSFVRYFTSFVTSYRLFPVRISLGETRVRPVKRDTLARATTPSTSRLAVSTVDARSPDSYVSRVRVSARARRELFDGGGPAEAHRGDCMHANAPPGPLFSPCLSGKLAPENARSLLSHSRPRPFTEIRSSHPLGPDENSPARE